MRFSEDIITICQCRAQNFPSRVRFVLVLFVPMTEKPKSERDFNNIAVILTDYSIGVSHIETTGGYWDNKYKNLK